MTHVPAAVAVSSTAMRQHEAVVAPCNFCQPAEDDNRTALASQLLHQVQGSRHNAPLQQNLQTHLTLLLKQMLTSCDNPCTVIHQPVSIQGIPCRSDTFGHPKYSCTDVGSPCHTVRQKHNKKARPMFHTNAVYHQAGQPSCPRHESPRA